MSLRSDDVVEINTESIALTAKDGTVVEFFPVKNKNGEWMLMGKEAPLAGAPDDFSPEEKNPI